MRKRDTVGMLVLILLIVLIGLGSFVFYCTATLALLTGQWVVASINLAWGIALSFNVLWGGIGLSWLYQAQIELEETIREGEESKKRWEKYLESM